MSTTPSPTISEVLLTFRRPRPKLVRRMCDQCLIGNCPKCETPRTCTCICNDADVKLAA